MPRRRGRLLRRVLQPGPLTADRVCEILATQWGGLRVHIGRRWRPPEISQRDTPSTVQDRYRVSRSTAHRWINGWRR